MWKFYDSSGRIKIGKAVVSGELLAYNQFVVTVTGTATTEATANEVVSAGAVVFDGGPVLIEFYAPVYTSTGGGAACELVLFEGSTPIGRLLRTTTAVTDLPVYVARRFSPTAGSKTYSVRIWGGGADPSVQGGASGAGVVVPGFIRITRDAPGVGASAVQPSARVFHGTTQAVADATDVVLAFNSERWDTDGIHDVAVSNSRLTCRTAGKYSVKANVEWPNNGTGVRQLMINVNGAASGTEMARVQSDAAGSTVTTRQVITCDLDLAVGDFVEVIARQTSTVSLTIPASTGYQCEFSMHRFSA